MSDCDHDHERCSFSYRAVDNTPQEFIICSFLRVTNEEAMMFRLARFLTRVFLSVIGQIAQLFQVLRRLVYVLLLIMSSFLAQLHICLYIGDSLGVLEITSKDEFYPLYDWSQSAERFLICCGIFLWFVYIFPNRKGVSLWAQGIWALQPPLWVAFLHIGGWALIWGPLANAYAIYEGMSLSGRLTCMGVLAGVYYVQVWQDIIGQIKRTQKIKAQSRRFARRTQRV